ncbi:MAG: tRNA (N6-threonylcarbamoyladenosine(37)-N6)-methyltransferase TrmO [Oscillospiraceae bacterium]|nr:tRNA (N6-threonylcarbamoyladenosine(37)-N6)-methyltransferase TrmO [Oscillospiraceae bacterium]
MELIPIAHIRNDFGGKFGIPRQSGLADNISHIVFEKEFRVNEALRGIEGYSHLWLIWQFEGQPDKWSPTVRPPRLGGNKRMGVFATRSPNRPNPVGLSSVRLLDVKDTSEGKVLVVSGADLLDGTVIFDIKPYLTYTDCHTDASDGFSDPVIEKLRVILPDDLPFDEKQTEILRQILSQDPRPQYRTDTRTYTFTYADHEVTFHVEDGTAYVDNTVKAAP